MIGGHPVEALLRPPAGAHRRYGVRALRGGRGARPRVPHDDPERRPRRGRAARRVRRLVVRAGFQGGALPAQPASPPALLDACRAHPGERRPALPRPRLPLGRTPHPAAARLPEDALPHLRGARGAHRLGARLRRGPGPRRARPPRPAAGRRHPVQSLPRTAAGRRAHLAARRRDARGERLPAAPRPHRAHAGARHHAGRQDPHARGGGDPGHPPRRGGGGVRPEGRRGPAARRARRLPRGQAGGRLRAVPPRLPGALEPLQRRRPVPPGDGGRDPGVGAGVRRGPVGRLPRVRLAVRQRRRARSRLWASAPTTARSSSTSRTSTSSASPTPSPTSRTGRTCWTQSLRSRPGASARRATWKDGRGAWVAFEQAMLEKGLGDEVLDGLRSAMRYEKSYFDKLVASLLPLLEKLTTGKAAELFEPRLPGPGRRAPGMGLAPGREPEARGLRRPRRALGRAGRGCGRQFHVRRPRELRRRALQARRRARPARRGRGAAAPDRRAHGRVQRADGRRVHPAPEQGRRRRRAGDRLHADVLRHPGADARRRQGAPGLRELQLAGDVPRQGTWTRRRS